MKKANQPSAAADAVRVNQHHLERVLRVGVGLKLLYNALVRHQWKGMLGLYPLLTGITGRCPAYDAIEVSTTPYPRSRGTNPLGRMYVSWLDRSLARVQELQHALIHQVHEAGDELLHELAELRTGLFHELKRLKQQLIERGNEALDDLLAEAEQLTDELLAEAESAEDTVLARLARLETMLARTDRIARKLLHPDNEVKVRPARARRPARKQAS